MRKILTLLLLLTVLSNCKESDKKENIETKIEPVTDKKSTTEIKKNDLLEYNLKGKVKGFSAIKYKAKDSFGIVLKDGIHKDKYSSLSDYEETISFNKEGYVTRKTKHNDGVLIWKENIIRDSLYRKIESNKFNSKNKLTGKQAFKYNKNGKISEMNAYKNDGDIEGKWIYIYEEKKMTRNNYNSDGSMYSSYISTYNDKGALIEFKYLDYEERKYNYTNNYSYNVEENTKTKINKLYYSLELEDTKWLSKYNESGDLIKKTLGDSYITKYEYEYDEQNNWTKQIEYSDGFPEFIIERKINYFN